MTRRFTPAPRDYAKEAAEAIAMAGKLRTVKESRLRTRDAQDKFVKWELGKPDRLEQAIREVKDKMDEHGREERLRFLEVVANEAALTTKTAVARTLGVSESTVYRWIQEHEENQRNERVLTPAAVPV